MHALKFLFIGSILQKGLGERDEPLVEIPQGHLKGIKLETWGGTEFLAFQGIPYAEPPIRNRRFEPPLPAKPWRGVLDATSTHIACPQISVFFYNSTSIESEDCLLINVYTRMIEALHPVVVFIHGGGFVSDDGTMDMYGPHILLDKEVVLVTFNYRLGAFGFLSLGDEVLPGNNGLKDQNLALRWVKDNIRYFGGDPDKVTIFGNSAGGASVYFHILSPLSTGLFHAAISSSGIATSSWALTETNVAKHITKTLAMGLNCTTSSSREILECLQAANFSDISKEASKLVEIMETNYGNCLIFTPVIEPKLPGEFISENPVDIIQSGNFSQVPYMIGITKDDGAIISARIHNSEISVEKLNSNFDKMASSIFNYESIPSRQNISREIRQFYVQDRHFNNDTKSCFTDMVTDGIFYYPSRATAELHVKYSTQPVYFYLFGYKGSYTYLSDYGDTSYDYGVVHCDDLIYLLSDDELSHHNSTETDLEMRKVMTTLVDNFANTENPTPDLDPVITRKWLPLTADNFNYYAIMAPNNLKTKSKLFEERYNFWKKLSDTTKLVGMIL